MTRTHGGKDAWLAALRADGRAFREAAGAPDALGAEVPSCPEWRGEDLVRHLGAVYGWIRGHVSRGVTSQPDHRPAPESAPAEATALLDWFDAEHAEVVELLDTVDPQMPAWNWAPQPKVAVFWHRRIAHETAMHRWDAQMAIGQGEPVEARLAADGVSEVLDTWLPGGRRKGPTHLTGVVQLDASDVDESWLIRLRAGGGVALLDTDTLLDDDEPQARVTAAGSASDLLLALWGRVGFDTLDVAGEAPLLEALRTG